MVELCCPLSLREDLPQLSDISSRQGASGIAPITMVDPSCGGWREAHFIPSTCRKEERQHKDRERNEAAEHLLAKGGDDLESRDRELDATPIIIAIEEANLETIRFLVTRGADVNAVNNAGARSKLL